MHGTCIKTPQLMFTTVETNYRLNQTYHHHIFSHTDVYICFKNVLDLSTKGSELIYLALFCLQSFCVTVAWFNETWYHETFTISTDHLCVELTDFSTRSVEKAAFIIIYDATPAVNRRSDLEFFRRICMYRNF